MYRVKEVDLRNSPKKWSDWSPFEETGSIRLRPLEGIYRRWKELSPDIRNAIIPLGSEIYLSF
jgi:hypothetical protein